jgi:phosphoribosylamine--glycine ligase
MVFHAGTTRQAGNIVTAGGRVLGVTGLGPNLMAAKERAYLTAREIRFDGCHFRSDIAHRALQAHI